MSLDVWIREVVWTWEHISAWCSKRFVHVYVYKHKYAFIETHSEFKYLKTYLPVNASRCADLRSYLSVRIHICMMWQAFCPYRCVYIQMCIHIHATTQILNSNLQVIFTCKCHWMCGFEKIWTWEYTGAWCGKRFVNGDYYSDAFLPAASVSTIMIFNCYYGVATVSRID